ncbi:hypothetical protein HAHE_32750 [Haloferula helveola]|uniref:PEP-CTERM protein-sorting domain-containing protein n=1 Tax=Haloferula helveola TaxID=490095 RepID=A0ABN6H8Z2_9BACT|nr:hypothetical protein HAHE_32750 [Haloferula helveola]
MKTALSPALITAGLVLAAVHPASAVTTLLDDTFGNGNLATNPDTGGGFAALGNGIANPGSVTESGSLAQITEGDGSNTFGMISSNTFDLSNPSLTYTTTWEIDSVNFGTAGSIERMFFTLQTNNDFLFAGGAEESRLLLVLDAQNDNALLRYQNRSSGANANFDAATFSLGSDFTGDADGFTATMTLDATGFTFTTIGLDAANQVSIFDTWANIGTDFSTVLGTDGDMHVATYVQDTGTTGSTLGIDRITLTSVPEPNAALLGAIGALMLLRRRRSD